MGLCPGGKGGSGVAVTYDRKEDTNEDVNKGLFIEI